MWYNFLCFCKPRFRRQEIIGNYIADFYCHDAKLIIEIDGSLHYEPLEREKDNERSYFFHTLGLRILRFSNSDVNRNFDGVCQAIILAAAHCGTTISVNSDAK